MARSKYLYIHKFEWNDEFGASMFNGEPKNGRVYLAEESTHKYRILLLPTQEYAGVNIKKDDLVGSGENWDCDIEVVSIDNLLDLELSSKDLKMMAENVPAESMISEDDIIAVMLDSLDQSLGDLMNTDPDAHEALVMISTILSESMINPTFISLTEGMENHPKTAKITNISIAISELESYLNEPNHLEMSYVLNALRQLFIETIRLHKLNKITI